MELNVSSFHGLILDHENYTLSVPLQKFGIVTSYSTSILSSLRDLYAEPGRIKHDLEH